MDTYSQALKNYHEGKEPDNYEIVRDDDYSSIVPLSVFFKSNNQIEKVTDRWRVPFYINSKSHSLVGAFQTLATHRHLATTLFSELDDILVLSYFLSSAYALIQHHIPVDDV